MGSEATTSGPVFFLATASCRETSRSLMSGASQISCRALVSLKKMTGSRCDLLEKRRVRDWFQGVVRSALIQPSALLVPLPTLSQPWPLS